MWSSARSPGPTHVAAAMFTPASLIAAATCASAPGVFSMSMTKSTGMCPVEAQRTREWRLPAYAPDTPKTDPGGLDDADARTHLPEGCDFLRRSGGAARGAGDEDARRREGA